jgi:hypothetical protein
MRISCRGLCFHPMLQGRRATTTSNSSGAEEHTTTSRSTHLSEATNTTTKDDDLNVMKCLVAGSREPQQDPGLETPGMML